MPDKLLWHSNAPFVPTGYGTQTGLFAPLLAEHYDLAVSAFYGLEGAPIKYNGVPVLPGLGGEYGNASLPQHATRFFGGDPRGGIVVTLMDVWVLDTQMIQGLNCACWVPVDHQPCPPKVSSFFAHSDAIPIAMSRFGEQMLTEAGLRPLYVPHAVDTEAYRPLPKDKARGDSFPDGAFVVGMVAANKGRPSRKAFSTALRAFAEFAQAHEDAYLYLHTVLDPNHGLGENLPALLTHLGIPPGRIRVADQYSMMHNPYSTEDMANVYNALDVLLNPSWGEGFGIPILEAQACSVPAIVTDFSAMPEVCGAGWRVKWQSHWTGQEAWQAIPDVNGIVAALEECRALRPVEREKMMGAARRHALNYDVRRVVKSQFLPALREVQARFEARRPVTVSVPAAVAA